MVLFEVEICLFFNFQETVRIRTWRRLWERDCDMNWEQLILHNITRSIPSYLRSKTDMISDILDIFMKKYSNNNGVFTL